MYKDLIKSIATLNCQSQLCVLGSAMIDLRMNVARLPVSGEDTLLDYKSMHLGGCAFNIALALKRIGVESYSALPIGKGLWATQTAQLLRHYGISSPLYNEHLDNGWCMALVEPSGERTFFTVEGAETHWNDEVFQQIHVEPNAIIYLSGYQLLSPSGIKVEQWLQRLKSPFRLVIDFGPRIERLTKQQLHQLLNFRPLLTLNRQEAHYLAKLEDKPHLFEKDIASFAQYWQDTYDLALLIRLDQQGALVQDKTIKHVAAFPVTVKDSIGAGDSHTAGVLAGLSSSWSLEKATLLGNAIASYVVAHEGGDCSPTKEQLIRWLETSPFF